MPYTREEFAASIKEKYPAYQKWDDDELVDKVTAKHPVYKEQISDFVKTSFAHQALESAVNKPNKSIQDVFGAIGEGYQGGADVLQQIPSGFDIFDPEKQTEEKVLGAAIGSVSGSTALEGIARLGRGGTDLMRQGGELVGPRTGKAAELAGQVILPQNRLDAIMPLLGLMNKGSKAAKQLSLFQEAPRIEPIRPNIQAGLEAIGANRPFDELKAMESMRDEAHGLNALSEEARAGRNVATENMNKAEKELGIHGFSEFGSDVEMGKKIKSSAEETLGSLREQLDAEYGASLAENKGKLHPSTERSFRQRAEKITALGADKELVKALNKSDPADIYRGMVASETDFGRLNNVVDPDVVKEVKQKYFTEIQLKLNKAKDAGAELIKILEDASGKDKMKHLSKQEKAALYQYAANKDDLVRHSDTINQVEGTIVANATEQRGRRAGEIGDVRLRRGGDNLNTVEKLWSEVKKMPKRAMMRKVGAAFGLYVYTNPFVAVGAAAVGVAPEVFATHYAKNAKFRSVVHAMYDAPGKASVAAARNAGALYIGTRPLNELKFKEQAKPMAGMMDAKINPFEEEDDTYQSPVMDDE